MKKALIGKKVGMTQIFDENGTVIPVTVIEAGPCVVAQVKTIENDGYEAVQLGCQMLTLTRFSAHWRIVVLRKCCWAKRRQIGRASCRERV